MKPDYFSITPGRVGASYHKNLRRLERNSAAERLMNRDAGLFTRKGDLKEKIANRLGWVDIAAGIRRRINAIENFGNDVIRAGFKHVLLMGMGGSSLCPDLFGNVFGVNERLATFDVLDSTDPRALKAIQKNINLDRTLFIVSSKSGTTVETRSQMTHFVGLLERSGFTRPGRQFIAITDKDSALHKIARSEGFRKIYLSASDIGGRYSALSYFGMVPGFFAGVDLTAMTDDAAAMERLIRHREGETNPAAALASLMAAGEENGIDKLTFLVSKQTAPLVPWIEQLVAESTGKEGKGVVPIEGELPGKLEEYHNDRMFVVLRMASEKPVLSNAQHKELKKKGFPIAEIQLGSRDQLGGQFMLWMAATALTGYLMGINPFDEPNVTESKENSNRILDGYRESGQFADLTPIASYKKLSLITYGGRKKYTQAEIRNLKKVVQKFLAGTKKPQYVSLLCYLKEDRAIEKILTEVRTGIRRKFRVATLRGYGPRYLHSIGQLYKGGPEQGRFVVFMRNNYEQLEVPGRFYDFGQLISAQAIGDVRALLSRNLPLLVIAIDGNAAKGLKEFADVVHAICK